MCEIDLCFRTLDEKKGRGIHRRVLHYTAGLDIRPLASLAEVKTLSGSCTLSGHFFCDTRHPGEILVREVACLNCPACVKLDFAHCKNGAMCGQLSTRTIQLVSGARAELPGLRSAIQCEGYQRAKTVIAGMLVGSENAEEKEPYIISRALGSEQVWVGADGESWNGTIKAGDKYIRALKLHRVSVHVYTESDIVFYMNSEDVRVPSMTATDESARRLRNQGKTYKFLEKELDVLKCRVYVPQ